MRGGSVRGAVGEGAIGLALAGLGAAMAYVAAGYGFGSLSEPGSGLMPGVIGLLLAATGLGLGVQAAVSARGDARLIDVFGPRVLLCAVVLLGAAMGMTSVGFVPTAFVFLAILFASLGEMPLPRAAAAAAAMALAAWWIFVRLLGVQLPALGVLGF
jgi:putative tricarboxylic transport membrane protein